MAARRVSAPTQLPMVAGTLFLLAALAASPGASAAEPSPSFLPATTSDEVATRTLLGPLPDDPVQYLGRTTAAIDVVAGGPGFVAVGGSIRGAVVWTSVDGTTWDPVPDQASLDGGLMISVTAGGPGLVAVGSDGSSAAAWVSPDGIAWERVAHDPSFDSSEGKVTMTSVARLADGSLVAVGGLEGLCGCEGEPPRVGPSDAGGYTAWWSPDGREWQALGERQADGPSFADVIALGDGWLSVSDTEVRISADRRTWKTVRAPASFTTVERLGGRLVAAGPAKGRRTRSIWTSRDGETWRPVGPTMAGAYARLARDEGGHSLLLTTNEGRQAALWRSADGKNWDRVRVPSLRSAVALGLTSGRGQTVVVGMAGEDAAAAWVLPPVADADGSRPAPLRHPWAEPPPVSFDELPVDRALSFPALAALEDGRVLVVGGYEPAADRWSRQVDIFDPSDGSLVRAADLPSPLWRPRASAATGGRVFVVGREEDGSLPLLRWDVSGGAWTSVRADIRPREEPGFEPHADGTLLTALREVPRRVSVLTFDPLGGGLAETPAPPFADIRDLAPTGDRRIVAVTPTRAWTFATASGWRPGTANPDLLASWAETVVIPLADGTVAVLALAFPGVDCSSAGQRSTLLDRFAPASGTWTQRLALPEARTGFSGIQLRDGRLLLVGGESMADDCTMTPAATALLVKLPA